MKILDNLKNLKEKLKLYEEENAASYQTEENILVNAKLELSTLNYLKMEAEIESKRSIRTYNIDTLKKSIAAIETEYNLYLNDLRARTNVMAQKRKEYYYNFFEKNIREWFDKANLSYGSITAQKKMFYIISYGNKYYPSSNTWGNTANKRLSPPTGDYSVNLTLYYTRKTTKSSYTIYEDFYGIPLQSAFDKFESVRKSYFTKKPSTIKNFDYNNAFLLEKLLPNTWSVKFPFYKSQTSTQKSNWGKIIWIYDLVDYFFPSIVDYERNPELYPHIEGFMEETPWPSSKELDGAFRKVIGVGSPKWAEKQIEYLKSITEYNLRDDKYWTDQNVSPQVKALALPPGYYNQETKKNVSIPFRNLAPTDSVEENLDPALRYYSPRPKSGYLYVPYFDYINPHQFVPFTERERTVNTPSGDYYKALQEAEREKARQEREARWASFKNRLDSALGGGFSSMIFNPGGLMAAMSCGMYGEDSKACGFAKDMESVSRALVRTWVAAAASYMTGGTSAAIAATVSTVASDPNLGIADSDLGQVIVALAEAYAIASVTDSAIDKALTEVLETQIYAITKREIGKATGLDRTLLGRLGLDLTAGTAFAMYKQAGFTEAITGSADKAWRIQAAKENPYAAMMIAGVTEIEKNGFSIDSMDPMDWFNNISLSGELNRLRHTVRGRDLAKMIGLTYMVSAGRMSEQQALEYIGQEASVRNLTNFYQDKPLYHDPEMAAYREKQADVNRWKKGISVIQKLSTGVPPSKDDIMILTNNVAEPIYDRIKSLGLPTEVEVNLWNIAITEVGLPNVAQYMPDVSFELPNWMKSKSGDGNLVITNPEKFEANIAKSLTKDATLTKEDIVELILSLMPKNVPLVPLAQSPVAPTFNFIDINGNLKVRDPLTFPYDHPMLATGRVKKKYSKAQLDYMKARDKEMLAVQAELAKLQDQYNQLLAQGNNLGVS